MQKRKNIFVLWSGGADSTYAIQRCIEDEAYQTVLAGYVLIKNNLPKAQYELTAIDKMVPILMATGKFVWTGIVAEVLLHKTNPNLQWKQLPLWCYSLAAAVHASVDEVAIGLNASDFEGPFATLPREGYLRLWDGYRPLMRERLPELVFPAGDVARSDLHARLRPELRAACVCCEAPISVDGVWRACGQCHICRTHGG